MTILTISNRGTLKLPKEIVQHFKGAKHVQVKIGAGSVALTPVQIQYAGDIRAIPAAQPPRPTLTAASSALGR
jgi:hypothetical protein